MLLGESVINGTAIASRLLDCTIGVCGVAASDVGGGSEFEARRTQAEPPPIWRKLLFGRSFWWVPALSAPLFRADHRSFYPPKQINLMSGRCDAMPLIWLKLRGSLATKVFGEEGSILDPDDACEFHEPADAHPLIFEGSAMMLSYASNWVL